MDSKAQITPLNLIIVFVALIIIILLIYSLSSSVGFAIRINDSDVPQGVEAVLSYDIKNSMLIGEIKNVVFEFSINDQNDNIVKNETRNLGTINALSNKEGEIVIDTYDLAKGKYTIWTSMHYWTNEKLESKHLSLELTIY